MMAAPPPLEKFVDTNESRRALGVSIRPLRWLPIPAILFLAIKTMLVVKILKQQTNVERSVQL
jgi:hypothetical protein